MQYKKQIGLFIILKVARKAFAMTINTEKFSENFSEHRKKF